MCPKTCEEIDCFLKIRMETTTVVFDSPAITEVTIGALVVPFACSRSYPWLGVAKKYLLRLKDIDTIQPNFPLESFPPKRATSRKQRRIPSLLKERLSTTAQVLPVFMNIL